MESRAHAFAAGVFTLLLGVAIALAILFFSGQGEHMEEYVLVSSGSVGGLTPQSQVRYRGMRVGKVREVYMNPADPREVLVRVAVPGVYPISRGTTAQLGFQGLTGLALIDLLDEGVDPTPIEPHADGTRRIRLRASVIDTLDDHAAEALVQLQGLLRRSNQLLDQRNIDSVSRTLANLEAASARLEQTLGQTGAVLERVRAVLSPDNVERISRLLSNLEQTSAEGAPVVQELRRMVQTMQTLASHVDALGADAGAALQQSTLPRMNQLLDQIGDSSRQLNRLLSDLERSPDTLLFGRGQMPAGPGERGFDATR